MRYGVFVNKFLVADFPSKQRDFAVLEAIARGGELYDFWTGKSLSWTDLYKPPEKLTREEAVTHLKEQLARRGIS